VKESFTIHDLPVSERPRERLQKYGAESLSAQEILARYWAVVLPESLLW